MENNVNKTEEQKQQELEKQAKREKWIWRIICGLGIVGAGCLIYAYGKDTGHDEGYKEGFEDGKSEIAKDEYINEGMKTTAEETVKFLYAPNTYESSMRYVSDKILVNAKESADVDEDDRKAITEMLGPGWKAHTVIVGKPDGWDEMPRFEGAKAIDHLEASEDNSAETTETTEQPENLEEEL